MLEVLGVWARLADAAQPVTEIELTDSSLDAGIRPTLLTYRNEIESGEPGSHIVPNEALTASLEAAVEGHPSVSILRPAIAKSICVDGPSVSIRLADGQVVRASLLIAADGRHSPMREASGITCVGWNYGQRGIVTRVEHEVPHKGRAVQHFLPSGPFAILPMRGNRSCITWSEDEATARNVLALDDEGFLSEVDQRVAGRYGTLRLVGPRASWPLEMHLARRYVGPRFALLGDAAHGVHPIAGQGLNLAFRDIAALTECVTDAARLGLDLGDQGALERYESWRRFDSTVSAATFDGLNRLFSNDWTLMRSAREFGLGLVDRIPALKQFFVSEAAGLTGDVPRLLRGERV
jgi:2-octaprenyl-6-methoxyphenol hydroxylase